MTVFAKALKVIMSILKVVTRIFLYISYFSISVMTVMTVIDVVRRYFFGLTMNGMPEYSQMLLIVCMAAMAYALVDGRFIAVGILVERFPKVINLAIEILMGVLSFAFFMLVGIQTIGQIRSSIQFNELYFMIGVPKWPMYGALGASFLACTPAVIVYVYDRIVNFKDRNEKTVFDDNPDLAILAYSENENTGTGGE